MLWGDYIGQTYNSPNDKTLGAVWLHFFDHSISITHNSSLNFSHPFGIITQFPSLNIFHIICGPIPVSWYNFFFFFFLVPKLTEASIIKLKKKKKNRTANPGKKNLKVIKSCGWYCLRVPHVCLITKMPLSFELWKLKIAKMYFQFP